MSAIAENRDRINEVIGLDNKGGRLAEMDRAARQRDKQFAELQKTLRSVDKRTEAQGVKMSWLVGIAGAIALAVLGVALKLVLGG